MSKSALKALAKADAVIKESGVTVAPLVEYLNDGKSRKSEGRKHWKNADNLAALIINSVANAFQCEALGDLKNNGFQTMSQAVDSYISSNLDDWKGYEHNGWKSTDTAAELSRLAEMVKRWINFHKPVETDEANVCNACACLIANDDADMFSNSFTENNARTGIASWCNEWNTLSIDHDQTERDVSFGCECCGERIHGEKFHLVLANFRN